MVTEIRSERDFEREVVEKKRVYFTCLQGGVV